MPRNVAGPKLRNEVHMPSGGARLNSGPAPDPNSYNSLKKDWYTLPAAGFTGPTPVWPLLGLSDRESELWVLYWLKPQAILWDQNNQQLEVALHVRRLGEVELPDSSVSLGTLIKQQMDALLLTIPALNSAHIVIGAPGVPVAISSSKSARRTSSGDWLTGVSVEGA
jgi:hypothetical protein